MALLLSFDTLIVHHRSVVNFSVHLKNPSHLELVFKELNHLAAILHVYAGLIFMK